MPQPPQIETEDFSQREKTREALGDLMDKNAEEMKSILAKIEPSETDVLSNPQLSNQQKREIVTAVQVLLKMIYKLDQQRGVKLRYKDPGVIDGIYANTTIDGGLDLANSNTAASLQYATRAENPPGLDGSSIQRLIEVYDAQQANHHKFFGQTEETKSAWDAAPDTVTESSTQVVEPKTEEPQLVQSDQETLLPSSLFEALNTAELAADVPDDVKQQLEAEVLSAAKGNNTSRFVEYQINNNEKSIRHFMLADGQVYYNSDFQNKKTYSSINKGAEGKTFLLINGEPASKSFFEVDSAFVDDSGALLQSLDGEALYHEAGFAATPLRNNSYIFRDGPFEGQQFQKTERNGKPYFVPYVRSRHAREFKS